NMKGYELHKKVIHYAAAGKHIKIIKWMRDKVTVNKDITEFAVTSSNLYVLDYCIQISFNSINKFNPMPEIDINDFISFRCLNISIKCNYTNIFKFLMKQNIQISPEPATRLAVIRRNTKVLEALHDAECLDIRCMFQMLCYESAFNVLKWAVSKGYDIKHHT